MITAAAVLLTLAAIQIGTYVSAVRTVYAKPDYPQTDISSILEKTVLSDSDYELLYRQTGLTKIGVDRCRVRGRSGLERIKRIQTDMFSEYTVSCDWFAPFCCSKGTDTAAACCFLENGDILISSATHIAGCAVGHAGLVTDAARGEVLQAVSYFKKSSFGAVRDFTARINFMILSPVAPEEVKEAAARYAKNNLAGKNYGVCPSKRECRRTHCAHLVWYAYKQLGIDLDSNGGFFVTPKNIANSPRVRVVQVFGFRPDSRWL